MIGDARTKDCCVDAYSSEAVRWLVGDTLHPGGTRLTDRLARSLGVGPGDTVIDVACGRGESATAVAQAYGCDVIGVDLATAALVDARERAAAAGVARHVTFVEADAEELPLDDATVDAVLSECALCLMPNRRRAAIELARVLRHGGRLALADVTARPELLPPDLRTSDAQIACLAGAQPLAETVALLEDVGFVVDELESHPDALHDLLRAVDERLRAIRVLGAGLPSGLSGGLERGLRLLQSAQAAVEDGIVGYAAVFASRR